MVFQAVNKMCINPTICLNWVHAVVCRSNLTNTSCLIWTEIWANRGVILECCTNSNGQRSLLTVNHPSHTQTHTSNVAWRLIFNTQCDQILRRLLKVHVPHNEWKRIKVFTGETSVVRMSQNQAQYNALPFDIVYHRFFYFPDYSFVLIEGNQI